LKYINVHSHFYQPPRENPWLEVIELQDSAYPFHDWNERISSECYGPNAVARILDTDNNIIRIVNNYASISFNVGPTLMSWLERSDPETYAGILSADRESRKRFSGHGNAIAQAFHHMIMPLASARDKETQILWGIADFMHRFGRQPEGMWLPETAVDTETLELLAKHGIRFTILSPYQALRVRPLGSTEWQDASGGRVDPSRPYQAVLPSGRSLALFFYDGPLSQAVAFERLLDNGERFATRLAGAFPQHRTGPQLVHIATDGETYGHHHRHGDMALAYALDYIDRQHLARLTNYGEFLEIYPAEHQAEIQERTAWSCAHGVGRWQRNCGCSSGGHWGWNQEWREPLRAALDWLRDLAAVQFQALAGELVEDPWEARNAYIKVVLDRSPEARADFLSERSRGKLTEENQVRLWKLMELQRHAMMMYTSCGWFFDDLSGIETVQIINYAGRVVQLYENLTGEEIEATFLEKLALAKSNVIEQGDGATIYKRSMAATRVDPPKLAAHYAISSMFETYLDRADVYSYQCDRESWRDLRSGRLRLMIGSAYFTSNATTERTHKIFGVLHFGDHNVTGGVAPYPGKAALDELDQSLSLSFERADIPELIRSIDKAFGGDIYTLQSLFKDEQRRILREVLESTVDESEIAFRRLYQQHAPLMRFLGALKMPLPKVFQSTAGTALNGMLRRALSDQSGPVVDVERVKSILEEARSAGVQLDATAHEYSLRRRIEHEALEFSKSPKSIYRIEALIASASLQTFAPFHVYLSPAQTRAYGVMRATYSKMARRAQTGDAVAIQWVMRFDELAKLLRLELPKESAVFAES
jgi:alpha-amylase/alpha-mannosidase (GH57 family)